MPSTGIPECATTKLADAAISEYYVVKRGTDDSHVATSAVAAEACLGIANEAAATGQQVTVNLLGYSFAIASAAIAAGGKIMSSGDGRVAPATAAAGVNAHVLGIAVGKATAAGDKLLVLLVPSVMQG
ncbi:MAG: DUF2190 family protein [Acidithiobacillus sp.]|nr:DUF2190 family protein [Acidithiobacillus sp.]